MMEFNFNIEGGNFSRAGTASSEIKKILKQLNVDSNLIKRIVVALYEAEVNVVAHAWEGNIYVHIRPEGYYTDSPEVREMGFGAGMGLPNMQKNCDKLQIESEINIGTKVTMLTYLKPQ